MTKTTQYRNTAIELIPDGWETKPLGELFNFKNGINAGKESYGSGVKFINVMEVIYNDAITADKIFGTIQITEEQKRLYLVKYGDVLFNRTSETTDEIGLTSTYYGNEDVVFGGFVIRGRPLNNFIDDDFKRYCFRSKIVRNQIIKSGQGAIRTNIGQGDLEKVNVPLPPLSEQKKIAKVLSIWDKTIFTCEALLKKYELRKKGMMQKLLSGKGKGWEEVELGEIVDYEQPTKYIVKDTLYNEKFETPVLTAGKTFLLGYTNENDGICKNLPVIIFDDFTTASKFVDFPFKVKSSAMKLLRAKENADIKYIFEAIQMIKYTVGGHERHWISKFAYLTIPFPPIEEQKRISKVLLTADQEISFLKSKVEKLKEQKKGLMQQLLTGKIRTI